jgi:hypothetical protein
VYQVTGDPAFSAKAWSLWYELTSVGDFATFAGNENQLREQFIERVMVYDWLYPSLTPTQRQEGVAALTRWAEAALAIGTPAYTGGFRLADSDQTVGSYFGLALLDQLAVPENGGRGTWLAQSSRSIPVGGLDATAANLTSTARNAIRYYVEILGEGGEWIESSEYNPGTNSLLMLGYAALETSAPGHFPEIAAWLPQAAFWQEHEITPDWGEINQWGDEEEPRTWPSWRAWKSMAMLSGLLSGTPAGQHLQKAVQEIVTRYESYLRHTSHLWARAALLWDPGAPRLGEAFEWERTPVVRNSYVGHYTIKRADSTVILFAPRPLGIDHALTQSASFKIYRDGEWVLDHPLGYGAPAVRSASVNAVLFAGLSAMIDRGPTRFESGADWWALTADTQGSYYGGNAYDPPPVFVSRGTRRLVYWREGSGWDVVVVRDDITAGNPMLLQKFQRYASADRSAINRALAGTGGCTKEIIFHAPSLPTLEPMATHWVTAKGKSVRIVHLSPRTVARAVYAESAFLPATAFRASEMTGRKQIRLWNSVVQDADVFLNVVLVGAGTPPGVSLSSPSSVSVGGRTVIFDETSISVT